MKNKYSAVVVLCAVFFSVGARAQKPQDDFKGIISLSGAWALYPMAVTWAEQFQAIHPKVKIDISAGGAGKGMADCLAEVVDIGMVSRDVYPAEVEKGAWWVSVTKDAVVPTMNGENPLAEQVLKTGITRQDFINIWITGEKTVWGTAPGRKKPVKIRVYTRSDACGAAKTWAKFLGAHQEDLGGVGVYGDPGLTKAVQADMTGIGFNNITYAYDAKTGAQLAGIRVIPIDTNNNGVIDGNEDFYETREQITAAIADGRYPSPPARNLHFVCHGKPQRPVVREFLRWVLTEGQQYVESAGYIELTDKKLAQEIGKLK